MIPAPPFVLRAAFALPLMLIAMALSAAVMGLDKLIVALVPEAGRIRSRRRT